MPTAQQFSLYNLQLELSKFRITPWGWDPSCSPGACNFVPGYLLKSFNVFILRVEFLPWCCSFIVRFSVSATFESHCTSVSRCVHPPWSCSACFGSKEAVGVQTQRLEWVLYFAVSSRRPFTSICSPNPGCSVLSWIICCRVQRNGEILLSHFHKIC